MLSVENFNSVTGHGLRAKIEGLSHSVGRAEILPMSFKEDANRLLDGHDGTSVVVANERKVLGAIVMSDVIRDNASGCLPELRSGLIDNVTMLTGDRKISADRVRSARGLDCVQAELLPKDKLSVTEALEAEHGAVVMIGDRVNDAPAPAAASVGAAMAVAAATGDVSLAAAIIVGDIRDVLCGDGKALRLARCQ